MFETTGVVDQAEILFDGTRSKGAGVVQFAQEAEAETAIGAFPSCIGAFVLQSASDDLHFSIVTAKFQQYVYGGRPLGEFTSFLVVEYYFLHDVSTADYLTFSVFSFVMKMCGSMIAGTRSPRLPQKVVKSLRCKATELCRMIRLIAEKNQSLGAQWTRSSRFLFH